MASPTNSQVILADQRLDQVFSHFYCVQQATDAPALPQQLLPTYERLLIFNFGLPILVFSGQDASVFGPVTVLGPLQQMLRYELPPGADFIVVNFTLDGFQRLTGQILAESQKVGENTDEEKLRAEFQSVWEKIVSLPRTERLAFISDYIFLNTAPSNEATLSLYESIPYFAKATMDPVKVVADTQGVTTRSIQLRFQMQLGYSAKELARFLRFKKLVQPLCQLPSEAIDWMAQVQRFGYHDQSHLIKDFQHFVGMSPRQFMQELGQGGVCFSRSGVHY